MGMMRDAVESIDLGMIESQMELDDYMPESLAETYGYDLEEAEELDWYEVLLRAIVIISEEAKGELMKKYGILDATKYPEE
jgi:hypothetical protein